MNSFYILTATDYENLRHEPELFRVCNAPRVLVITVVTVDSATVRPRIIISSKQQCIDMNHCKVVVDSSSDPSLRAKSKR
jgi:hypothetical protein